eukprot:c7266_g1_i4.p1 GENE.c7266_g1_i4~~c7266_g1_i4.p1  ORF type:complete len:572 (+),score=127.36 c7266_g1_i4:726-2441(+)
MLPKSEERNVVAYAQTQSRWPSFQRITSVLEHVYPIASRSSEFVPFIDELVMIAVMILRSQRVPCRIIFDLKPLPLKPPPSNTPSPSSSIGMCHPRDGIHRSVVLDSRLTIPPPPLVVPVPTSSSEVVDLTSENEAVDLTEEASDTVDLTGDGYPQERVPLVNISDPELGTIRCGIWLEMWVTELKRWVMCCVYSGIIDNPKTMCTSDSNYITALGSPPLCATFCDVTARYVPKYWVTAIPNRASDEWWKSVLKRANRKFEAPKEQTESEHKEVLELIRLQPIPTRVDEFRRHPIYCIDKFFKENQIIYPIDAEVVGRCKEYSIYLRENLHTLRSEGQWFKMGYQVVSGQVSYKQIHRIRGRGKVKDAVDLFGLWQTVPCERPTLTVDNKIPKNRFGSIEMWGPHCLPQGTVHIPLPNVSVVCKQLGIDFAPAMVGYTRKGGKTTALCEGVVVLTTNEGIVRDAWHVMQQKSIENQNKKRQERIYANWRTLVRGILVRDQLNREKSKPFVSRMPDSEKEGSVATATVSGDVATPAGCSSGRHVWIESSFEESTGTWRKRCGCGYFIQYEEI